MYMYPYPYVAVIIYVFYMWEVAYLLEYIYNPQVSTSLSWSFADIGREVKNVSYLRSVPS